LDNTRLPNRDPRFSLKARTGQYWFPNWTSPGSLPKLELDNTGFKTQTRGSLPKLELEHTGLELETHHPRFSSKAKTRQAHYWINENPDKTFSSKPEEN
jgi:hypothetical protein